LVAGPDEPESPRDNQLEAVVQKPAHGQRDSAARSGPPIKAGLDMRGALLHSTIVRYGSSAKSVGSLVAGVGVEDLVISSHQAVDPDQLVHAGGR
jgi:hypothetical protein